MLSLISGRRRRWPFSELGQTGSSYQDPDGGRIHAFETADIDGLRVVPEPVAKVGPGNHHGGPFLAVQEGQSLENILDV